MGWAPQVAVSKGDPLAVAAGYVNWPYHPSANSGKGTLTSGSIYTFGLWLPFGATITNVVVDVQTAAAGTKPTLFKVGLATPAGRMLAQSADLSGASGAPFGAVGKVACALSATYQVSASDSPTGFFRCVALLVGSYGTTQPQFSQPTGNNGYPLGTGPALVAATAGGKSDLPANGSSLPLASSALSGFWMACS